MSACLFLDDREIEVVRRALNFAKLPVTDLVVAAELLERLPESAAAGCSPDSSRAAATDPQTARGFQLRAHTPAGDRFARDLDLALSAVLPHCNTL